MANFKLFDRMVGEGTVFVNVDLVTYVTAGRETRGGTLIHFDHENAVLVQGDPEDVMDKLSPGAPAAASGT